MIQPIKAILQGRNTIDGAGVKLKRILPIFKTYKEIIEINPFLLFDEFKSDKEEDYIHGFPTHQHKGFQTITYMKRGSFEHRDTLGNVGVINEGGIQWMVAGSGIEHSEMPILSNTKEIWGFQLWFNLPREYKYIDPYYKNIEKEELPLIQTSNGFIKILFGKFQNIRGIENPYWDLNYFDITLFPKQIINFDFKVINKDDWILIYVYQNNVSLKLSFNTDSVVYKFCENHMIVLEFIDNIVVMNNTDQEAQLLFLSSKKLLEPIARYGPFVMNYQEEILETFKQFR